MVSRGRFPSTAMPLAWKSSIMVTNEPTPSHVLQTHKMNFLANNRSHSRHKP